MRAKGIKHAEFEILKYLLTGRGTNLAGCQGLTDLGKHLGVDYPEHGLRPIPIEEAKDKVVQKRWQTANKNLSTILINMMSKRANDLPDGHVNKDWDKEDLEKMVNRAHRGELI